MDDVWVIFTFGPKSSDVSLIGPYGDASSACQDAQRFTEESGVPTYVDRLVNFGTARRYHALIR